MKRYFFCIILKSAIGKSIDALKHEISRRYHVYAALRLPPHMTLVPPFVMPKELEILLIQRACTALEQMRQFKFQFKGFGSFGNRVCFVDIEQSPELVDLSRVLFTEAAAIGVEIPTRHRSTHFHVTLATKDVNPRVFKGIDRFLQQKLPVQGTYTVQSIYLMRHTGEVWEQIAEIPLENG